MSVTTFESGASSSEEQARLDLLPLEALIAWADRMGVGAKTHGDRNYEKGANDPVFIRDRHNHLLMHALKAAAGDESDDHLAAVMANAAILIRLKRLRGER